MGCCCSRGSEDGGAAVVSETEMREHESANRKVLAIARGMSAPSIDVQDYNKASGHGLALSGVVLEQDAAYFEVHVEVAGEGSVEIKAGVATKKDRQFYKVLEEAEGDTSEETNGTALMTKVKVSNGDVLGVAVQQSDLPMVQFLLNDEPLFGDSINRFKGQVYPAVYLPEGNEGVSLKFVFSEKEFKKSPPSSRFYPVMVARGLV